MHTDTIIGYDPTNPSHYGRPNRRALIQRTYAALLEAGHREAADRLRREPSVIDQATLARRLAADDFDGWVPDARWQT